MTTQTNESAGRTTDTSDNPYSELVRLCRDHADAIEHLDELTDELTVQTRSVVKRRMRRLTTLTTQVNITREALLEAVRDCPELFITPRSRQFDGVKIGFRKEQDKLNFDESTTIGLVRKHMKDQANALIKTKESLIVSAAKNLDRKEQAKVGIGVIEGEDQPFVNSGIVDIGKLIDALISQALQSEQTER